jgi:AcrR family transcriptional regulator
MLTEESSPRERRYQRTQQAILAAALSILTEEGVDKLSIRAIADRIDYSPAALYEYYGSKEEIIGALCWEGHRTLKRYMEQVPLNLAPDDYLLEIGTAYIHFALQNPAYFLLIFTSPTTRPTFEKGFAGEASAEMMDGNSAFPLLLNGVQRAIDSGVIHLLPGLSVLETAYAFWAVVHGAAMLQTTHLSKSRTDFEHADRLTLAAFIRGMRS